MDSKDEDGGSYRLATTGDPVDDGRTPDGRPKALRYNKKVPHQTKKQAMDDLKQECDVEEHKLSIDVLCTQLQTDPELGLTPEQARDILLRDGPNALTPPKKTSEWVKFSKNLFGGFAMLLWVGAFLCFIAYAIQSSSSEEVPDDNVSINIFDIFNLTFTQIILFSKCCKPQTLVCSIRYPFPLTNIFHCCVSCSKTSISFLSPSLTYIKLLFHWCLL